MQGLPSNLGTPRFLNALPLSQPVTQLPSMLPRPTLRKIFRENLPAGDDEFLGLEVPDEAQSKFLADLAQKLAALDRVEANYHEDNYVTVMVGAHAGRTADLEWFVVHFCPFGRHSAGKRRGLWIMDATYRRRKTQETMSSVPDVNALLALIDAIRAKQTQAELRKKRNTKLVDLKQRSLKSRLIELGREHQFSFALGESQRDVNLSIRVGGKRSAYHLAFPKGQLDAVLEQVPNLVATLEQLRSLGVNFRTNNKAWAHRQGAWIDPEDPIDDDHDDV